jgi:hypothetical protein
MQVKSASLYLSLAIAFLLPVSSEGGRREEGEGRALGVGRLSSLQPVTDFIQLLSCDARLVSATGGRCSYSARH